MTTLRPDKDLSLHCKSVTRMGATFILRKMVVGLEMPKHAALRLQVYALWFRPGRDHRLVALLPSYLNCNVQIDMAIIILLSSRMVWPEYIDTEFMNIDLHLGKYGIEVVTIVLDGGHETMYNGGRRQQPLVNLCVGVACCRRDLRFECSFGLNFTLIMFIIFFSNQKSYLLILQKRTKNPFSSQRCF